VNGTGRAMVNLGCGGRYHPDWVNFDLTPIGPAVRPANFIEGIPLADGGASCVYHSHVLEHLPLDVARRFLRECRRVLAPGGVIRVVVPDLEQTARDYLAVLDARRAGRGRAADHRWMLIEMFDQMVRTRPGGEFAAMLAEDAGNDDFVLPRVGAFGGQLAASARNSAAGDGGAGSLRGRVFRGLTGLLPGRLGQTLREVRYRRAGEIHLWMYDELFLKDVLEEAGFTDVRRESPTTSSIPDFGRYGLDVEPDGKPWKGVSLYVEARRGSGAD
jgi:predicted SAM-dependent methyltransferase